MVTSYSEYPRFYVSVDCAIFAFKERQLQILIHQRPYQPAQGQLSLIGGFVQQDEDLDTAAARILREFTGLDHVYMQQLSAYGDVERDPGERVISIAYYALINAEDYNESLSCQTGAQWVDADNLPALCFDHNQMVNRARQVICEKFKTTSVGSNLLPRYFTLSLLQRLYESILGQPVDKRNFRRSIADKQYIHATNLIDRGSSHRGATLYEFR
ncbi:MAG: NUDIX hydrolase [Bacteroidaceae bacterium]|nr:NUDIX hydrolase [Bacteroidaceae bacterium]